MKDMTLRVTKVDFSGVKYLMEHPVAKHLKSLKLTWLSRTQLTDQLMYLFGHNSRTHPSSSASNSSQQQQPPPVSPTGTAEKLIHLELINNNIHAIGVRTLLAHNVKLTILNLSHNPIRDDGALTLSQYSTLRDLTLRDCEITDVGASALLASTLNKCNLVKLDLSSNQNITDNALQSIANNTCLMYLHLTDTNISDIGCDSLTKAVALRSLQLEYTKIGNDGAKKLLVVEDGKDLGAMRYQKAMAHLEQLNVRQTKVNKQLLIDLKKFLELKSVQLVSDFP